MQDIKNPRLHLTLDRRKPKLSNCITYTLSRGVSRTKKADLYRSVQERTNNHKRICKLYGGSGCTASAPTKQPLLLTENIQQLDILLILLSIVVHLIKFNFDYAK